MPEILALMMGTYASGTPYRRVFISIVPRVMTCSTYRYFSDTFRLSQHRFENIEEIFSRHMFRHDAQCIDIGPRSVNAESVRPESKYFTASSIRSGLRQPSGQGNLPDKLLYQISDAAEYELPDNSTSTHAISFN